MNNYIKNNKKRLKTKHIYIFIKNGSHKNK